MRGRRVISLLLSLVMALSLCSGVWATGEVGGDPAPAEKTQSDEGLAFTAKIESTQEESRELRFFNGMAYGYMTYYNNATLGSVKNGEIPAVVNPPISYNAENSEGTESVFVAFKNDGTFANTAENMAVTVNRENSGVSITYITTSDTSLCVYKLTATRDLGKGTEADTVDCKFHDGDKEYSFAIVFRNDGGNSEGNKPQGEPFKGMKAALEASNTAALAYVDKYLVDSTGHVKFGTGELDIRNGENAYSDAEVAAAKAAIMAFRNINWVQRDPLGNVRGVQIEEEWTDCFGCYLAELASRVGISLWGDYPSRNGVDMTLSNGKTISFYTDCAYGVPAYNESLDVEADNANKTYTIPYTQPEYCFTIPAGSGEVKSLTVKGATSTELKNDNNEVIGYSCQPFQNSNIKVETRCDGWFGDDSNKTYLFSVQVSYDREAYDLPLVITYNDNTTAEFNVKAIDPNPWEPTAGVTPANASAYMKNVYDAGFKFPTIGRDFNLVFPEQLKEWTEGCDKDWDYKWYWNNNTGVVTIEVNYGNEERWLNAAKEALKDSYLPDGIYFRCYFGTSDSQPPTKYGADAWYYFSPIDVEPVTLDTSSKMIDDYHHNNGIKLATLNKTSSTTTAMTIDKNSEENNWVGVMAMDNEQKTAGEATYKYAVEIEIIPTATTAKSVESASSKLSDRDRIHVTPNNEYTAIVPEDGTVFLRSNDFFDNNKWGNCAATLTVDAPKDCTLVRWYKNYGRIENGQDQTVPSIPLYLEFNEVVVLRWQRKDGSVFEETVVIEYGGENEWMKQVDGTVVTPNTIMNSATRNTLESNGIYVAYDPKTGYFSTTLNASELNDVELLKAGIPLDVPQQFRDAVYYRMILPGGSENPAVHNEEYAQGPKNALGHQPLQRVDSANGKVYVEFAAIRELSVNDLTVFYAKDQLYHISLVQWLDADENVLGYSYVYGRNGDFVTSVPTETKQKVNEEVGAPTLEWGGQGDPGFTCDKNPQSGGDGSKVFFQFSVKNKDGISKEHKAVIYLPYEYFGMTKEDGLRRAARGETPVIYHYFDESCSETNREVIHGEYTPYGVKFETGSFSPFVVDCSTTSAPSRYHLTTAAKADSPETFDGGIALYGALAVTSLTGMAYVGKKRED